MKIGLDRINKWFLSISHTYPTIRGEARVIMVLESKVSL